MIISIAGVPGSGKSTVAKILAKRLGFRHYSMGDLQRGLAKELGITLEELGDLELKDKRYDLMIDQKQTDLGKNEDNFVIDGRLSWYFVKNSIKIFLDASPAACAERIMAHGRAEESFKDIAEAKKGIKKRMGVEQRRYRKYYGVDIYDKKNFHFVIDTSRISAEEVVEEVIKLAKDVKEEISAGAIVVNPRREYLLLYQRKGKFWEFPKGHIEKSETELGAMKRELLEETGIRTFEILKGFKEVNEYIYREKKKIIAKKVILFLVGTNDPAKISHEHTKYKWVAYKDAMKSLKFNDMKELLSKADAHIDRYIEERSFKWMK